MCALQRVYDGLDGGISCFFAAVYDVRGRRADGIAVADDCTDNQFCPLGFYQWQQLFGLVDGEGRQAQHGFPLHDAGGAGIHDGLDRRIAWQRQQDGVSGRGIREAGEDHGGNGGVGIDNLYAKVGFFQRIGNEFP